MNDRDTSQLESKLSSTRIDFDRTIELELEHLNKSSSEINAFESRLDAERAAYTDLCTQSQRETAALAEKLRKSIDKARPYFEAKFLAKEANVEAQKAAWRYERACSLEEAAKEMVHIAEQTYFSKSEKFGTEWQETLNAAVEKVNEAEKERIAAENEHQHTMLAYREAEQRATDLMRPLKVHVERAEAYFDAVEQYGEELADRKAAIERLERDVASRKREYAIALHHLELISNELHRRRAKEGGEQAAQERSERTPNDADYCDTTRSISGYDCKADSSAKISNSSTNNDVQRSDSMTSVSTSSSVQLSNKPHSRTASGQHALAAGGSSQSNGESRNRATAAPRGTSAQVTANDGEKQSSIRPSSADNGGTSSSRQRQTNSLDGKSLALPTVDLLKASLQNTSLSYVSYETRVAFERQLFSSSTRRVEPTTSDSKPSLRSSALSSTSSTSEPAKNESKRKSAAEKAVRS